MFLRALMCGLGLSTLLVLAYLYRFQNPLSSDPYGYLSFVTAPWNAGWFAAYHRDKGKEKADQTHGLNVAQQKYELSQAARLSQKTYLGVDLYAVPDGTLNQCFSVKYEGTKGPSFSIASRTFEKRNLRDCEYLAVHAIVSDDFKQLAVQIEPQWSTSESEVWRFALSTERPPRLIDKIIDARLVTRNAFLGDGSLLFVSLDSFIDSEPCAVSIQRVDQVSCFISKNVLGDKKTFTRFIRDPDSPYFSILIRDRGSEVSEVHFFGASDPIAFNHPIAKDATHYAPLKTGGIFSLETTHALTSKAERNFWRYDAKTKTKTLLLTVPLYESSTSVTGFTINVASRKANGEFGLWRLSESGIQEIPLSPLLSKAPSLTLSYSRALGVPRVRIKTVEGSVLRGSVDDQGQFSQESIQNRPTPVSEQVFYAPSADGAMVPCVFWAPLRASRPLRGIVLTSYGAYGSLAASNVTPLMDALLASDIGYLTAVPRGSGDLGRAWADAGIGAENKIKTVEDTEACIKDSIQRGFVRSGKVLMQGTSAGAIPAMLTALRNPNLVAGAWVDSPFLDSSGGHRNSWLDDLQFGSLENADAASKRKALSPYHNLLIPSNASGSFLLSCGMQDGITPIWQCLKGYAALRTFHPNKMAQLLIMEDKGHFEVGSMSPSTLSNTRITLSFILDALAPSADTSMQ